VLVAPGLALLLIGFSLIEPVEAQTPDASPAQGHIVYITKEGRDDAIYRMNADGTGQQRVFSDGSGLFDPALSPDGQSIAFVSSKGWRSGIYVIDVEGKSKRSLTSNSTGADGHPRWSPDGKKILYISDSSGAAQFYTMNPDGTAVYRLTRDTQKRSLPAWSPDGSQINFAVLDGTKVQAYVMNADGTDSRVLPTWRYACQNETGCVIDDRLIWSPDGSAIAFESNQAGTGNRAHAIYTMNADGTNIQRVTPPTLSVSSPAWSPDGRHLVFVAYESEDTVAFDIIDRDGSNLQTLIRGTTYLASPSWSK
jgi:TolB protein